MVKGKWAVAIIQKVFDAKKPHCVAAKDEREEQNPNLSPFRIFAFPLSPFPSIITLRSHMEAPYEPHP